MEIIGYIGGAFTIIVGIFAFYIKFIKPRFKKTKLQRFYQFVQEWFDYIDRSDIENINVFELNNIENKVSDYISDHKIKDHIMKFSDKFKMKFYKFCTLSKDNYTDKEFERFSRLPAQGITIEHCWNSLMGEFRKFRKGYIECSPNVTYADVEMRIKALKMYFGVKIN